MEPNLKSHLFDIRGVRENVTGAETWSFRFQILVIHYYQRSICSFRVKETRVLILLQN